jgi:hypothetical protein
LRGPAYHLDEVRVRKFQARPPADAVFLTAEERREQKRQEAAAKAAMEAEKKARQEERERVAAEKKRAAAAKRQAEAARQQSTQPKRRKTADEKANEQYEKEYMVYKQVVDSTGFDQEQLMQNVICERQPSSHAQREARTLRMQKLRQKGCVLESCRQVYTTVPNRATLLFEHLAFDLKLCNTVPWVCCLAWVWACGYATRLARVLSMDGCKFGPRTFF